MKERSRYLPGQLVTRNAMDATYMQKDVYGSV